MIFFFSARRRYFSNAANEFLSNNYLLLQNIKIKGNVIRDDMIKYIYLHDINTVSLAFLISFDNITDFYISLSKLHN